ERTDHLLRKADRSCAPYTSSSGRLPRARRYHSLVATTDHPTPGDTMKQLTKNVFVETELRGSNHGLVATSDGIVLIDTPHKPSDAVRLRAHVHPPRPPPYILTPPPHPHHPPPT